MVDVLELEGNDLVVVQVGGLEDCACSAVLALVCGA